MLAYGDIEAVDLATGDRWQRVSGNGESRLVKVARGGLATRPSLEGKRTTAKLYQPCYADRHSYVTSEGAAAPATASNTEASEGVRN